MTNDLVADLTDRLAAAKEMAAFVAEQRKVHALDAVRGAPKAVKALDKLIEDGVKATRDVEDLTLAIEQAKAQLAEHRRAIAEREADQQLARAQEIRAKIVAAGKRADAAAASLRDAYQEIDASARDLQKTGTIISDHLNRIIQRGGMKQVQARHAGLLKYLDMDSPTGHASEPLEHALTRLLNFAIRRPKAA